MHEILTRNTYFLDLVTHTALINGKICFTPYKSGTMWYKVEFKKNNHDPS